jgi:LmbE family N-acetylglucosaminyl deacetylase
MRFSLDTAQVFVPDNLPPEVALARTTHIGIGAHQDDLEIMAIDGILQCFQRDDQWFTGVVVTNGRGSARDGLYKKYTDDAMQEVRGKEQKKAAMIGEYAAQVLLDYPSSVVKDGHDERPADDLELILKAAAPEIVYTHNLADKHDTHIGVTLKVIKALRNLPAAQRPKRLFGCEVWRDLDWLIDADKIAFDVSSHKNLQEALVGVFDSQISGGKRYDLATMGRRRANATYHASHDVDVSTGMNFAMDLTPLIQDPSRDISDFVQEYITRLAEDVRQRIKRMQ